MPCHDRTRIRVRVTRLSVAASLCDAHPLFPGATDSSFFIIDLQLEPFTTAAEWVRHDELLDDNVTALRDQMMTRRYWARRYGRAAFANVSGMFRVECARPPHLPTIAVLSVALRCRYVNSPRDPDYEDEYATEDFGRHLFEVRNGSAWFNGTRLNYTSDLNYTSEELDRLFAQGRRRLGEVDEVDESAGRAPDSFTDSHAARSDFASQAKDEAFETGVGASSLNQVSDLKAKQQGCD